MDFITIFSIISIILSLIFWLITIILIIKLKDKKENNIDFNKWYEEQKKYNKFMQEYMYGIHKSLICNKNEKE